MKEFQNEQLFQELNNEVAANCCSGGAAYLYQDANYRGRRLTFFQGSSDLRRYNFNDKTSSIIITGNEKWAFYRDINYRGPVVVRRGGGYPFTIPNDSISSLRRIG